MRSTTVHSKENRIYSQKTQNIIFEKKFSLNFTCWETKKQFKSNILKHDYLLDKPSCK